MGNQMGNIRVIIVDDQPVVRSGLKAFLSAMEGLELVAEAGSGEEALDTCAKVPHDVILMDMVMPGMDGVATIAALRDRGVKSPAIALTSFVERDRVQSALKAGAISYLSKDVSADELAAAIRGAIAGRPSLSPDAARALIQATVDKPHFDYHLTDREREILSLMAKGLNNQEIAAAQMVSLSTVKFHVSNVLSKLGASTRTEAVALALQKNLVT